jgi:hypothetical protein
VSCDPQKQCRAGSGDISAASRRSRAGALQPAILYSPLQRKCWTAAMSQDLPPPESPTSQLQRTSALAGRIAAVEYASQRQVRAGLDGRSHAATANAPKIDAVSLGSPGPFAALVTSGRFGRPRRSLRCPRLARHRDLVADHGGAHRRRHRGVAGVFPGRGRVFRRRPHHLLGGKDRLIGRTFHFESKGTSRLPGCREDRPHLLFRRRERAMQQFRRM